MHKTHQTELQKIPRTGARVEKGKLNTGKKSWLLNFLFYLNDAYVYKVDALSQDPTTKKK